MGKKLFGNEFVTERENGVYLEEIQVNSLCNENKSPFFVYLESKIIQNIRTFKKSLDDVFNSSKFYYSTKANYLQNVLEIIDQNNVPFEIISNMEFSLLKKYNLNTQDLLIGGPYLPKDFIIAALKEKDPIFTVYNIEDLKKIDLLSREYKNNKVEIILRFIPPKDSGHLGIPYNQKSIESLENTFKSLENCSLIGILSHYGTQMNTNDKYRLNSKFISNIATELEAHGILKPKIFDFGGGFPNASSLKKNNLLDIFQIIKDTVENSGFSDITYYFEPGRYIIGDAAVCLMKVVHIDENKNYLFVNSGNHILPRFAKNSFRFYDISIPIKNYNHPMTFYGIMLSNDILTKNYNFTKLVSVNDYILAMNCGAYCHTFSNRFPYKPPDILTISGDKILSRNSDF